jgi:hypothetical protein
LRRPKGRKQNSPGRVGLNSGFHFFAGIFLKSIGFGLSIFSLALKKAGIHPKILDHWTDSPQKLEWAGMPQRVERFIEEVKRYCKRNKLLQKDLATILEMSPQSLNEVFRRRANFTCSQTLHLIDILGRDPQSHVARKRPWTIED